MAKSIFNKTVSIVLIMLVILNSASFAYASELQSDTAYIVEDTPDYMLQSVSENGKAVEISSGNYYHLLRTDLGEVWWFTDEVSPEKIENLSGIVAIDAGAISNLALMI